MRFVLFSAFVLSLLNFTVATPDSGPRIFHRRDICTENGQVDCYSNCMPAGAVCCSDGSGTYCPNGQYCVPNGCCPNGQECSGGGGTITETTLTGTAPLPTSTGDVCSQNGQVDCAPGCMPPGGVCCNDGSGTYCLSGQYCVPGGCCPNGEECSGGGGTITETTLTGTGPSPTATATPTGDVCSQNGQVDCGPGCMPPGGVCCNDGSGSYCQSGQYCVPGGCCPNGEVCSGSGETTTEPNFTSTSITRATHTSTSVTSHSTTTTSLFTVSTAGGNAVSALSHSSDRYALLLIAAGQMLLGW